MPQPSRYFDDYSDQFFTRDEFGTTIFYPLLRWGRGRVLPNNWMADHLRGKVSNANSFGGAVGTASVGVIFHLSNLGAWQTILMIVAFLLVALGLFHAWFYWLGHRFPISDIPLERSNRIFERARDLGRDRLSVLFTWSGTATIIGILIALHDSMADLRVWVYLWVVTFGASTIRIWQMMRLLEADADAARAERETGSPDQPVNR